MGRPKVRLFSPLAQHEDSDRFTDLEEKVGLFWPDKNNASDSMTSVQGSSVIYTCWQRVTLVCLLQCVLQYVVCYIVLQWVEVCYCVDCISPGMSHVKRHRQRVTLFCCSVLQCVALCCCVFCSVCCSVCCSVGGSVCCIVHVKITPRLVYQQNSKLCVAVCVAVRMLLCGSVCVAVCVAL